MLNSKEETCADKAAGAVDFRYTSNIESLTQLSQRERAQLAQVTAKYAFRSNSYYLSLIDWSDPDDPIRQLIVPHLHELEDWGDLDPSGEHHYTILPGLEHKYHSTALFLVSNTCGGICRYCFRKRVFINRRRELLTDLPAAVDYLTQHPEITNVLLTGGDPLAVSTRRLEKIFDALLTLDTVKIIRIGSKMPAFNPYRILNDPSLLELMRRCADAEKQLYIIVHFNHPREITDVARAVLKEMHAAGAVVANQTPIIRGINDNPDTMAELFKKLSFIGVPPYYVFQCRPASGNKNYSVPIEEAYQICAQAKAQVSGLAKRARYVMSHRTGKVEVMGLTEKHIFFKYHRAADDVDSEKFMVFERNPDAYWLDDYGEPLDTQPLELYQDVLER